MKFDPRPFAAHYRASNEAELQAIRTRADAARIEAQRLALAIHKADPHVRAVLLFGSLAEGGPRRLDFDIDLALDGGDVYKALDLTESSPFDVDVVRLDLLPEHLRARIRARGVILSGSARDSSL
jgi:predicted nucleotidyltransferase